MRKVSRSEEFNPWINVHTAEHEICPCGQDAVGNDRHGRAACANHAAPHAPFVEGEHLPIDAFEPNALERSFLGSKTAAEEKKSKGFKPPKGVQSAARHALELIEKGKAGDGFTSVGRGRAHQLANGDTVGMEVIKKMHSYFARHAVDKKGKDWDNDSPGKVAWLAWGGDAGRAWANSIMRQHGDKDSESSKKESSAKLAEAWPSVIDHEGHINEMLKLMDHHAAGEQWHTERGEHDKAINHMRAADALAVAIQACQEAM